jgi:cell division protein FtsL
LHTLSFFLITIASISGLIIYLWVYTEVDETLMSINVQKATVSELNNTIKKLQSDIARLSRVDRITRVAREELGMVNAQPESIAVYIPDDYN